MLDAGCASRVEDALVTVVPSHEQALVLGVTKQVDDLPAPGRYAQTRRRLDDGIADLDIFKLCGIGHDEILCSMWTFENEARHGGGGPLPEGLRRMPKFVVSAILRRPDSSLT